MFGGTERLAEAITELNAALAPLARQSSFSTSDQCLTPQSPNYDVASEESSPVPLLSRAPPSAPTPTLRLIRDADSVVATSAYARLRGLGSEPPSDCVVNELVAWLRDHGKLGS